MAIVYQTPSNSLAPEFIFATGIECSYPTISDENGRTIRIDELAKTFHYDYWREDLHLTRQMGIRYLRYGPPYYRLHLGPDRYDWEFTDETFREMRRLGIIPIADLCHFGVPDWIGDFQNPEWPEHFARYARAFAERFPWVQFYTPVNEIYVCTNMSTWEGAWNERKNHDDRAFVTAMKHLCRANLLAIEQILQVRPDAVFIQSESAQYYHQGAGDPKTRDLARFENERRFLSFDFIYSVRPSADICLYLLDNGMTREEIQWFMHHGLNERVVMGNDYYERNERIVAPDGEAKPAGEIFGWMPVTREYYQRYRRPVMHTETNTQKLDQAVRWLWKEFFNVRYLREQGVPVIGFTWYSLVDQVDWDSGLRHNWGVEDPVGMFDLQRKPRPVAAAFRDLMNEFGKQSLLPHTNAFTIFRDGPIGEPPTTSPAALAQHGHPAVGTGGTGGLGALGSQGGMSGDHQQGPSHPLPGTKIPAPPSGPSPKPQHVVAQRPPLPARATVSLVRTESRHLDEARVEQLVREALAPIGGIERYVKSGQTVLLKPNQTMGFISTTGVTTDPRLVAALARLALGAGAARVQVGEATSCGQITRKVMKDTGMTDAAQKAGAEPVYFDEVAQVTVRVPHGTLLKEVPLPKPLVEADVVISCPKLKTHFLDPVTGAIKLWVGAVRQDFGHHLHRDDVWNSITDLMLVSRPDLVVMDALYAGEGNGPVAVDGRWVGCVLASDDPCALDVIAAEVAGFDGQKMRFPRTAAAKGIGIFSRERIDVVGVPVEQARVALVPNNTENWMQSYPFHVLAGEGVTMGGTLGHFKGFADYWQKLHVWELVVRMRGTPTFMIGRIEDPDFEQHVREGPYVVLDDVALDRYKHDPRVTFIPGSPIGNEMMPVIMQALDVEQPGRQVQKLLEQWNHLKSMWLTH